MSSSSSAWEKRIALNATPTLVGRPIRSRRLQGFSTTASVTQGVEVLRKPEPL